MIAALVLAEIVIVNRPDGQDIIDTSGQITHTYETPEGTIVIEENSNEPATIFTGDDPILELDSDGGGTSDW